MEYIDRRGVSGSPADLSSNELRGYRRLAMLLKREGACVKPMQNAFVESFNGRLRDECLNEHVLGTLIEARRIIETWRINYNTVRPHTSLAGLAPAEFAAKAGALLTQWAGGTAPCKGSVPPARCSPAPKRAEQEQT